VKRAKRRRRGGSIGVIDGPFAETKELIAATGLSTHGGRMRPGGTAGEASTEGAAGRRSINDRPPSDPR